MMLKYVKGDLVQMAYNGEFEFIIHGCNCFHTMGAGIAKQIKMTFPEAYECDLKTPYGDRYKLGRTSTEFCKNSKSGVWVINAYTQFKPGRENPKHLYRNIKDCFSQYVVHLKDKKIGIPKIGCGIAGGDWNIVSDIIEDIMKDSDITVVVFED